MLKELTEKHLDQLFAQQKTAFKKKSVVLELSKYFVDDDSGLTLILVVDGVRSTAAATKAARDGAMGEALEGRFAFEYDGDQILDGVEFAPCVIGSGLAKTLATVEGFARKHGFAQVRSLGQWKGGGDVLHFWMGRDAGEEKPSAGSLANEWATTIGEVLSEWSEGAGEPVRNVVLYWGGEDHTGLEMLYVNHDRLDAGEGDLKKLLRDYDAEGAALELDDDRRPSFDAVPPELQKNRKAFLARLCATLETRQHFKPRSAAAKNLRVFSMTHGVVGVDYAGLLKARAELGAPSGKKPPASKKPIAPRKKAAAPKKSARARSG